MYTEDKQYIFVLAAQLAVLQRHLCLYGLYVKDKVNLCHSGSVPPGTC